MNTRVISVLALSALIGAAGCATRSSTPTVATTPRYADYPRPTVPASLRVAPEVTQAHDQAWQLLQAGDLRRAEQSFRQLVASNPSFYPAEAGWGFALLANRRYRDAETHFAKAVEADARYLPGWTGRAEALVALNRDRDAMQAFEQIVRLDPRQDVARTRLEFLRLRVLQGSMDRAARARAAGRLDVAIRELETALTDAPSNTLVMRELASVELSAGRLTDAEAHARRAIQVEPNHAAGHALLGDILEAATNYRDAAAAYNRAATLEPRDDWRAKVVALRERAVLADLPPSFAGLASAASITRADVAAYIGIHLDDLIERAPRRTTDVATDIRNHWASNWILPVTRAGVMSIYTNHTFQPGAVVRRSDLASIVASLVRLAAGTPRRAELTQWQAARPRFPDMASGHLAYTSAALAVSSGAMTVDAEGRFNPSGNATGADLEAAVRRVQAIAER